MCRWYRLPCQTFLPPLLTNPHGSRFKPRVYTLSHRQVCYVIEACCSWGCSQWQSLSVERDTVPGQQLPYKGTATASSSQDFPSTPRQEWYVFCRQFPVWILSILVFFYIGVWTLVIGWSLRVFFSCRSIQWGLCSRAIVDWLESGSARWPENPLQSDSRISAYCLTLIQRLFQNDTAFRLINHNTSVTTLWSLFIYEQTGHTVKTFIIWVRLQRINCAHLNASHTECGEKLPLYRGGKCHIWHIWVEHISWCRLIRLGEEMRRQICGEFYLKCVCVN